MTTSSSRRGDNWVSIFSTYKRPDPDKKKEKMTYAQRVAHLLNYAALKNPYHVVPYNVIVKYMFGYPQLPRMDNKEVLLLRNSLGRARPILQKFYKRDLKHVSAVGARATVDDLDVVKTSLPGNVRRVNSAHQALARNAELVDVGKLPAGPEKQWMLKTVTPALKALTDDPRWGRLLPPAPQDALNGGAAKPDGEKK